MSAKLNWETCTCFVTEHCLSHMKKYNPTKCKNPPKGLEILPKCENGFTLGVGIMSPLPSLKQPGATFSCWPPTGTCARTHPGGKGGSFEIPPGPALSPQRTISSKKAIFGLGHAFGDGGCAVETTHKPQRPRRGQDQKMPFAPAGQKQTISVLVHQTTGRLMPGRAPLLWAVYRIRMVCVSCFAPVLYSL